METALEISEDEGTPLLNTVETVEEEETHLVDSVETVLQIKEDDETGHLVNTLKSTLQAVPPFPNKCCIYRVPYQLRRANEEAYTPMVVSIGPFHHMKASLQEMEVQKQRYLNDFLERRRGLNLEDYCRLHKGLETDARNCYAESIPYLSNAFIKMMLLDGCFIVELFLKSSGRGPRNEHDPLFTSQVMRNGIRRDLVLLENQLPFFILDHLFNLNAGNMGDSFNMLTLNFLGEHICGSRKKLLLADSTYNAKHIVDLSLHCYFPENSSDSLTNIVRIPNATRLHESGVKFTNPTGSSGKCLLDVKFTSGNLEIPPIRFEDNTETFLRNLIAFEQVHKGDTQFFSEYTFLMDCLIDTPGDVKLLRKAGIIKNFLGDDEEVSQLFNKLCSGVVTRSRLYHKHCEDINNYCNTRWHTWMATLRSDYFKSPWTFISFLAGGGLLILTVLQNYCMFYQCQV